MATKLFSYSFNLKSPRKLTTQSLDVNELLKQAFMLHKQGKMSQAKLTYEQILQRQPNNFDALHLLGVIAGQNKNHSLAVEFLIKAVEINPNSFAAHLNLGLSLKAINRTYEAIVSYDRALQLKPDLADAHNNRGVALEYLNRSEEALECFDRAIFIKPDYARAHYNRGVSLASLFRLTEAIRSYDYAIGLNPEDSDSYFNKSLVLIAMGNFELGWKLYERRWGKEDAAEKKRPFIEPMWQGSNDIANKTILLYAEQGFGDTIQFCRYASLLAGLGAKVVLEVQRPLIDLLSGLDGVFQIVSRGDALPYFDYQCPLMSLPFAFNTGLDSIPNRTPYLFSSQAKREIWTSRLGDKKMPRVGLVWSGNPMHENDINRSLRLSELIKFLPDGFEYISLQKEVRDTDFEMLVNSSIRHFGESLSDYSDTAALCDLMDLVLSVDTSVAHLAGALGKPVWVLLPRKSEFRWLLDRDDSPWYPSAKLFRQGVDRRWDAVLTLAAQELLKLFD